MCRHVQRWPAPRLTEHSSEQQCEERDGTDEDTHEAAGAWTKPRYLAVPWCLSNV